jgi:hypothetical protein
MVSKSSASFCSSATDLNDSFNPCKQNDLFNIMRNYNERGMPYTRSCHQQQNDPSKQDACALYYCLECSVHLS